MGVYKREHRSSNPSSNSKTSSSTPPVFSLTSFKTLNVQRSYFERHFLNEKTAMPDILDISFIDGSTKQNVQEGLRTIKSSGQHSEQILQLSKGSVERPSSIPDPPYTLKQLYQQLPPYNYTFFDQ